MPQFDGKADEGFFVGYSLNSKALEYSIVQKQVIMHVKLERRQNLSKITFFLPLWTADLSFSHDPKSSHDDGSKPSSADEKKVDEDLRKESVYNDQEKEDNVNSTNNVNAASTNEEEPKKVIHALKDPRWIEAMQEELLQFKLQEV
ncbi:hypothetical protein Tco_0178662 [Tanacetum coccineum]